MSRKKLTTEDFINNVLIKFPNNKDKFDYSKVDYQGALKNVTIICKKHGEFEQRADSHLAGKGCPECGGNLKLTTEDFINKALTKFPNNKNKYDYSKVDYKDSQTKVIIICKEHGEFEQTPANHLTGNGCPICKNEKLTFNTEDFINNVLIKFPNNKDKFDYSKVNYQGALKNVTIICKKHGEFEQRAANHLSGQGCPICKNEKLTTEDFINKVLTEFPDNKDKYDYYKVDYQGALKNVTIICKKHGEFKQRAANHLAGNGCPICSSRVSKAETEIFNYIKNDLNIDCEQSNRKVIRPKELDIYIPSLKLAFEYNGDHWHSDEKISERTIGEYKTADSYHDMKTNRCRKKGIKLIHIAEQDYIGNEENMLKNIKYIIQERKRDFLT